LDTYSILTPPFILRVGEDIHSLLSLVIETEDIVYVGQICNPDAYEFIHCVYDMMNLVRKTFSSVYLINDTVKGKR
jgi:hypothetical protein